MTRVVSQPDHGNKLVNEEGIALQNFQIWIDDIIRNFNLLEAQINPVMKLNLFTVALVPDATMNKGGLIYVTDEIGGEVPAFSDGTNWRRVTDRTPISI